MLVNEGDRFFQWLEGPGIALEGLWSSIRRDERHGDIELLGEGLTPIRLFSEWDLRFLHRPEGDPQIPDSQATTAPVETDTTESSGCSRVAELALAGDEAGLEALVGDRRAAGDEAWTICRSLLEPAAHLLGDWWCEDRCDSFAVSIALSKLQNLARGLEAGQVRASACGDHRPARADIPAASGDAFAGRYSAWGVLPSGRLEGPGGVSTIRR